MQEKKLLYDQISETIVKDHKNCKFYVISRLLREYHITTSFDGEKEIEECPKKGLKYEETLPQDSRINTPLGCVWIGELKRDCPAP